MKNFLEINIFLDKKSDKYFYAITEDDITQFSKVLWFIINSRNFAFYYKPRKKLRSNKFFWRVGGGLIKVHFLKEMPAYS